jgi:hypothetical protein
MILTSGRAAMLVQLYFFFLAGAFFAGFFALLVANFID